MIHRKRRWSEMADTVADLRSRLAQCQATVHAIRGGEVDAVVVNGKAGERIYTLSGADQIYRVLIETMSEGAAALDRIGTILHGNRRLAEMLGRPLPEIIGESFPSFLAQHDREIFVAQLANERTKSLSVDVDLAAADGSTKPVHISMALLNFCDVEGICLVATDLSYRTVYERELAEKAQELTRSNSELERFAYVASHDLQEPLRMIGSFTQLLANRYKGRLDNDADEFIGFVVDGVSRMQALISDLLAVSRVGRKTCPLRAMDLEESLAVALKNLAAIIEESGAVIEQGSLPRVWGDTAQISRLFQNLIGNAIKFRSAQVPVVKVSAIRADDHWLISVRDNGIGIDPRHSDRIFVLFQRLHDRTDYPGTGIGLAICKKIVELHGGTIWLDSQPGAGACFQFTMPIRGDLAREPGAEDA